ncbi:MAG: hypothetical protein KKG04_05180 [Candidatus Thermoplasmatota archaeon]|nr:hypothetical protein [Candidatus Thermoplasmatota archaeon]
MYILMAITAYLKLLVVLMLLFLLAVALPTAADDETIPPWNSQWKYHQELTIPISTNLSNAPYQPIDLEVVFEKPCWTQSENETSIRVLCLSQDAWFELESQIYNLRFNGEKNLQQCSVVFLVPSYADGSERYFIFYHDTETAPPTYTNHVDVSDRYYSYSPFAEITAQAHYYSIVQDGVLVYGVGQEGQLLDRSFSQIIIKQQPDMEQFDVLNSDQTVSFAFSYYYGNNEEDESSSDQVFIDKKIWVDGNLMVEFGIISESRRGDIRTTAIYKYYYTPTDERRLSTRVRHEFIDAATVKGKTNIDGRYGTIVSIRSRNPRVQQMNSGTIFPYIHFPNEENAIEEYKMNLDPGTLEREWIIDYTDDADIGPQGWLAYGDGVSGKTRGVIFQSNQNLIKSGTDERDGIQLKVAEKEYFNFLGTEVDYASINFGRNSYEPGSPHDLEIPKNFVVEFDAEIYANDKDGYPAVQQEAAVFQQLVTYRKLSQTTEFQEPTPHYILKIITHFGGTRLAYPRLARQLRLPIPTIEIELYQNNQRIRNITANRSATDRSSGTFHHLTEGLYLVKVYWHFTDSFRLYTGAKLIRLYNDREAHIFCTFQRKLTINLRDQHSTPLSDIELQLIGQENLVYARSKTNEQGQATLYYPYNRQTSYHINALQNNLIIYTTELPSTTLFKIITAQIAFHNLTITIRDTTNQPPGVPLAPLLIPQTSSFTTFISDDFTTGQYHFYHIPEGTYSAEISYGQFNDKEFITLTKDTEILFSFTPEFHLQTEIQDIRGNTLDASTFELIISRGTFQQHVPASSFLTLPPATYAIQVYDQGNQIGSNHLELIDDKTTTIITSLTPLLPIIITFSLTLFMLIGIILYLRYNLPLPILLIIFFSTLLSIAAFQPWWILTGESTTNMLTKTSTMYLIPPNMIDAITSNGNAFYNQAELPQIFTDVLGTITWIIIIILLCLVGAIFTQYVSKQRYTLILLLIALTLTLTISYIFFTGMSALCDVSIGPVIGSGETIATVTNLEYSVSSTWGFSTGFYLTIAAALAGISAIINASKSFWPMHKKLLKKQN